MKVRHRLAPRRPETAPDPLYTTLHFTDGLTVSVLTCPRFIHRRNHWNDDGTCRCDDEGQN